MSNYHELTELLHSQNINYSEHGNELVMHCLFNDCDADSRGGEAHLYINKHEGTYHCKKCDERGNLITLKRHFGIMAEDAPKPKRVTSLNKLASKYYEALPEAIREYLKNERLLNDEDIDDYQLGYATQHGQGWITIPVKDRAGEVQFMKLRQDPFHPNDSQPKYKSTGGKAGIYNAAVLNDKPDMLVICEGEFDCLVLRGLGIPAICSTAGAGTFKDEWVEQLDFVREFYVAMDNDEAGRKGADKLIDKLAEAHPNSSVMKVTLPEEVGEHGDITDYFRRGIGGLDDLFEPSGKYVALAKGIEPIDISQFKEISLQDVTKTLSLTIKQDDDNKTVAFLCMLSAYTDDSQLNVSFNAPSSTGKTYTAVEVASLFPAADKIELSDASPTAFFHGEGIYDKERNAKVVSLERKILLLYEQPNPLTQQKLRAVLSHDERELHYRITNKDKKGANRAELIIIRGYPATVFCSAGLRLDEQETTRAILLSPEVTAEKIREGVRLQALRGADAAKFRAEIESNPERIALKNRILAIKREHVDDIQIPEPEDIIKRFNDRFQSSKPRHMRDMGHLMQLIKAVALLNVWHRRAADGTVVASQSDIDQAFELWGRLVESQDMNVPPAVMQVYKKYILPAYEEKKLEYEHRDAMERREIGLSRQELGAYYWRVEGTPLNDEHLRKQILPQLQASGLITQEKPKEGDKRSLHIYPVWYPPQDTDPNKPHYIGTEGGEREDDPLYGIDPDTYRMFFGK